jgi:hypothetical protein
LRCLRLISPQKFPSACETIDEEEKPKSGSDWNNEDKQRAVKNEKPEKPPGAVSAAQQRNAKKNESHDTNHQADAED